MKSQNLLDQSLCLRNAGLRVHRVYAGFPYSRSHAVAPTAAVWHTAAAAFSSSRTRLSSVNDPR